jgi:hypothetical protein
MTKMRYESLSAFHAARHLAIEERDRCALGLETRWNQLKDPAVRSILAKDAALDLVRSTVIGRKVHGLLHGRISGALLSTLGIAFASTRRGTAKRMLFSVASALLGKIMSAEQESGPGMLSKLAEGIGGIVRRMRERKAERNSRECSSDTKAEHEVAATN